ncbi:MAG TPA: dipeptide epimerase [Ferruginibacter sp.]|nr:dipeptide epimerase [Ferruginibacter sp.]HMP21550.1 dipeptide epimerase [Ferruginibacter sp.]
MDKLIITSVELYPLKIKLKEPFKISLGILTHAENVIVIIHTDKGISGTGECSPFKTINGESMETGMVVGTYLAQVLKGKNALDLADCVHSMNRVIYANNSIKSAFDMALYDIAAQYAKQPLYQFLGGSNSKTIFTDYTVSIDSPEKMASDAHQIKTAGFTVIKVKLGDTIEEDIERIRRIREAVGMAIPLRLDANQGWSVSDAVEILKQLAPYNIQHCEEPIPRWDFMQLPFIKKQSPIKIMADESCCDEHDAQRLLELGACDMLNIKLGKSSGIYGAKKIIALAEAQNITIQMGGFLESRLGFTAAAHVALCSNNILHFDFDTPLMFEEDPVQGGITYTNSGEIILPGGNGLGASFKQAYLQSLPGKQY